jgi:hypothetical protein
MMLLLLLLQQHTGSDLHPCVAYLVGARRHQHYKGEAKAEDPLPERALGINTLGLVLLEQSDTLVANCNHKRQVDGGYVA